MIYDVMASNLRASIGGNAPSDGLSPSATDSIDELAATSILYENVTQRLKIKSGVTSVPLNTPKTSIELQFVPENDTKSLGAASDESHNTWTGSSLSRRIRDGFETLRALEPSMPLCSLQFTVRANMAPKERKRLKNLQLQALRKGSRKAFAVPLRHRSCLK